VSKLIHRLNAVIYLGGLFGLRVIYIERDACECDEITIDL